MWESGMKKPSKMKSIPCRRIGIAYDMIQTANRQPLAAAPLSDCFSRFPILNDAERD